MMRTVLGMLSRSSLGKLWLLGVLTSSFGGEALMGVLAVSAALSICPASCALLSAFGSAFHREQFHDGVSCDKRAPNKLARTAPEPVPAG